MPKAIFFDLDGTLTDSGPGIMNCAEPALAHFGIQVRHRDELRVFVGPPLRQSFARFGVPEEGIDEAIRVFRERYVPIGKFENTPYDGIDGLLAAMAAPAGVTVPAAAAGVHGAHQHDIAWVRHRPAGPGDRHRPVLQGLAHRLHRVLLKFRQLIQE